MNIALDWDGALRLIASLSGTMTGDAYGADDPEKAIATLRKVRDGRDQLILPTGAKVGWFYLGGENHRTFVVHGYPQDGSDVRPYARFSPLLNK